MSDLEHRPTVADAEAYLKQPYARIIVPEENGMFRAEILEFPGCLAIGDTPAKALSKLEDVAESWIEAALDQGQIIPPPIENRRYSGRLVLRLPRNLHRQAAQVAEREAASLNSLIVTALALYVGANEPGRATVKPGALTVNATTNVTMQFAGMPLWANAGVPAQMSEGSWNKNQVLLARAERKKEPAYG